MCILKIILCDDPRKRGKHFDHTRCLFQLFCVAIQWLQLKISVGRLPCHEHS